MLAVNAIWIAVAIATVSIKLVLISLILSLLRYNIHFSRIRAGHIQPLQVATQEYYHPRSLASGTMAMFPVKETSLFFSHFLNLDLHCRIRAGHIQSLHQYPRRRHYRRTVTVGTMATCLANGPGCITLTDTRLNISPLHSYHRRTRRIVHIKPSII